MTLQEQEVPERLARCSLHPDGRIRHTWDERRYVLNQIEVSRTCLISNHRYECAECGRELHVLKETP